MENELAKLYNKLADQIAEMIPAEWDDTYYLGEVEKEKKSWSSVFYFTDIKRAQKIDANSIPGIYKVSEDIYVELLLQLNKTLLEIYDCFIENGQEPWEQLSFYFNKSGKFKVKFFYDVMNEEDGGQFVREIVWAYNTFGYIPAEGTYAKKILDKYLKKF